MIVVFKTGRSPSLVQPLACEPPPGRPITAVEKCRRHLIWWITIIEYNLKADRDFRADRLQPSGIASTER
jgi:hypothetical protein